MNVAVVYSRGLAGLEAPLVRVEAHVGGGLPQFRIVGLPETEVKEARDRVRAALQTAGFDFPRSRITVNLAPADLPKESGRFDLPIAIGILAATRQVPDRTLHTLEFAGELALSGELRAIRGALAMTFGARRDGRAFVLPEAVAAEAALARDATILPARTLLDVCGHLTGRALLVPHAACDAPRVSEHPDLADVRGQHRARRALEIAAAGGHSLLFSGPPGTGKTMLALRFPGILPGDGGSRGARGRRRAEPRQRRLRAPSATACGPFRSPHHTVSDGGAGRRRLAAASRRDLARAQRRAVPRRAARVQPRSGSRSCASRWSGAHHDLARGAAGRVPGARSCWSPR